MKKQHSLVMVTTLSLILLAVPALAQVKGVGVGVGSQTQVGAGGNARVQTPAANVGANASAEARAKTSTDVKAGPRTNKSDADGKPRGEKTIASRIEANDQLSTRLKAMLPTGMSLTDASAGFKNQGQFIAALHASKNLNIPFDQLKAKMTASDSMSLGGSIHALRPEISEDQAKSEAKKAEGQAKNTEKK